MLFIYSNPKHYVVINVKDKHKDMPPLWLSLSSHLDSSYVSLFSSLLCHKPPLSASASSSTHSLHLVNRMFHLQLHPIQSNLPLIIFISGSVPLCQHYKVSVLMVSLMVSDLCIKLHLQRSSKSTHNSLFGWHGPEPGFNWSCIIHAKVLVAQGSKLNQVSYGTLINDLCKIGETRTAIQLLRKIEDH